MARRVHQGWNLLKQTPNTEIWFHENHSPAVSKHLQLFPGKWLWLCVHRAPSFLSPPTSSLLFITSVCSLKHCTFLQFYSCRVLVPFLDLNKHYTFSKYVGDVDCFLVFLEMP